MADLMARAYSRPVTFSQGEQVTGKILDITASEVIIDLGAKAEGVLNKKELSEEKIAGLKVGDQLEAYVALPNVDSGQVVLSAYQQIGFLGKKGQEQIKKWQKFITAWRQQTTVSGRVVEANKGGLVIESAGIRGFLPSSQIGFNYLTALGSAGFIGQELRLTVIEVDAINNRLIFSTKDEVTKEIKSKLAKLSSGEIVAGKVMAIAPFGLMVEVGGLGGLVYTQEVSWLEEVDLNALFKIDQEIKMKILTKDENLGILNLSIRQLEQDPFAKLAETYQIDDVVKGTVREVTQGGAVVSLEGGGEGFLPAVKMEAGVNLLPGQTGNFLVDNVDKNKRRINLAPFLTSTAGLIYK